MVGEQEVPEERLRADEEQWNIAIALVKKDTVRLRLPCTGAESGAEP